MKLRELAAEPIFFLAFVVAPSTRVEPSQIDPDGWVNLTPAQRRKMQEPSWRRDVHNWLATLACKVGGFSDD